MDRFKSELAASAAKLAPPSGVSMWLYLGNHIDEWIKVATLVYIVVQITALAVTKWLHWTGRLKGKDDE